MQKSFLVRVHVRAHVLAYMTHLLLTNQYFFLFDPAKSTKCSLPFFLEDNDKFHSKQKTASLYKVLIVAQIIICLFQTLSRQNTSSFTFSFEYANMVVISFSHSQSIQYFYTKVGVGPISCLYAIVVQVVLLDTSVSFSNLLLCIKLLGSWYLTILHSFCRNYRSVMPCAQVLLQRNWSLKLRFHAFSFKYSQFEVTNS